MLRHALSLTLALALFALPVSAASEESVIGGSLSGVAARQGGSPLVRHAIRVRNVVTGDLAGATMTSAGGHYSFTNLPAGSYVVEITNTAGAVIGASAVVTLAPGAALEGVSVRPSAADTEAVLGEPGGSFFASKGGIALYAAAGAGVGVLAYKVKDDASPSK